MSHVLYPLSLRSRKLAFTPHVIHLKSNECIMFFTDLGSLTICNKFLFSGDEGTISAVSLSSAEAGDVLGSRRSRGAINWNIEILIEFYGAGWYTTDLL